MTLLNFPTFLCSRRIYVLWNHRKGYMWQGMPGVDVQGHDTLGMFWWVAVYVDITSSLWSMQNIEFRTLQLPAVISIIFHKLRETHTDKGNKLCSLKCPGETSLVPIPITFAPHHKKYKFMIVHIDFHAVPTVGSWNVCMYAHCTSIPSYGSLCNSVDGSTFQPRLDTPDKCRSLSPRPGRHHVSVHTSPSLKISDGWGWGVTQRSQVDASAVLKG